MHMQDRSPLIPINTEQVSVPALVLAIPRLLECGWLLWILGLPELVVIKIADAVAGLLFADSMAMRI